MLNQGFNGFSKQMWITNTLTKAIKYLFMSWQEKAALAAQPSCYLLCGLWLVDIILKKSNTVRVSCLYHSNTHVWMSAHTFHHTSEPLSACHYLFTGSLLASGLQYSTSSLLYHLSPPGAASITELHSWLQIINAEQSGHFRSGSTRLRGAEHKQHWDKT